MRKCLSAGFMAGFVLAIALFLTLSCSDDDNPAGPTYSVADLVGTWLGEISGTVDGEPMEQIGGFSYDAQGNLTEIIGPDSVISASGSLSVESGGAINGSLTSTFLNSNGGEENMTLNCTGAFVSKSLINLNGTGTWSNNLGDTGTIVLSFTLDKENFEYIGARLGYWPDATDKWWLMFRVMTKDATRVYATSENISGEYDLFNCDTFGYCDIWWSSNNAECIEGANNYNVGGEPDLPFDVSIHVVKPTGTTTHIVKIESYTTY